MLVLTRRVGESIRIGDSVRLTIRSKLHNHYTVAIAAPDHVTILDEADEVVSRSVAGLVGNAATWCRCCLESPCVSARM